MDGKIVANLSNNYTLFKDGIYYTISPRGSFRHKGIKPLVGDNVFVNEDSFTIEEIKERKNSFIRPKVANIDQIFLVFSLKEPDLSLELLYKYLTYILMNTSKAVVVFTKDDLVSDLSNISLLQEDLKRIGISSFVLGRGDLNSLSSIKELLKDKVSLFMGQTGVGKSSLINLLDESFNRKIGEYSLALGRGKHQTKEVILFPYLNGFIGDTPGFSSLDLNIYKEDLAMFYPGFSSFNECYYSNCLHLNEKDCAIKKKLESGIISSESYKIYLKILNELPYRKERYK